MMPNFSARPWRAAGTAVCIVMLLLLASGLSLAIGSRSVALSSLVQAFYAYNPTDENHVVIWALRLPRTLLALSAGAALGLTGAVMQTLTRNPMAEPGLLGVNAGAAAAVVLGASAFSLQHITQYLWFGWGGAAISGVGVLALGGAFRGSTDPIRLVLAGAGLSTLLGAIVGLVILNSNLDLLDTFRHWSSGALQNRGWDASLVMLAALALGGLLVWPLAGALNALSLGTEMGAALGVNAKRIWAMACVLLVFLAGTATATAGPIVFLGLIAGHISRAVFGSDARRILPGAAALAAFLFIFADILGRLILRPEEIPAGVMVTLLGAPVFLHLLRKLKGASQ